MVPPAGTCFCNRVFNSGSNIGAVIAPLVVPFIVVRWGWQWAFYLTGAMGLLWLALWSFLYKKPDRLADTEESRLNPLDEVASGTSSVSWKSLLEMKETWALGLARLVSDPIWWFYLFWIPKFLNTHHGLTIAQLGPPLVAIYVAADIGNIAGGYLSSTLIRFGWSPVPARKGAMLVSALAVTPMVIRRRCP